VADSLFKLVSSHFDTWFVYMLDCIDRFSYIEPSLHSWDEAPLTVVMILLMCS
ncbi:hypothetical protein STEG23_007999, partial [Scotinomys teguina]